MAGRGASPSRGQSVRSSHTSGPKVGSVKSTGTSDHRGHTKGHVPKTIATRKPRKWGK